MIRTALHDAVSTSEAQNLAARIDQFPALRSTVNANIYLNFVAIGQGQIPSFDKVDDFRHVIEASYCDTSVTDDRRLLNQTASINPSLTVLSARSL